MAVISALDSAKKNTIGGYISRGCGYDHASNNHAYNDLILSLEQGGQLEEAGIDTFDIENFMDGDERRGAIEDIGLDTFDFDMFNSG